jgi:cysteinyl-tRNA synthetase
MAKFWLHCNHLFVNGMKMSKSRGNTIYADTLRKQGYSMREIRFFLIYGHYQEKQNYTDRLMQLTATRLRAFRKLVRDIKKKAGQNPGSSCRIHRRLMQTFADHMDNDLHVRDAFDDLSELLSGIKFDSLAATEAAGIIRALREIDEVLQVIF